MDPLPSINKVFSYATQQERQLNGTINMNNLSLINATSVSHSRNPCCYCGKNGHTVEDYWKNNGYPNNFSSNRGIGGWTFHGNGRGSNAYRSSKVCNYCGFTDHTKTECFKKHGYPPRHRLHKAPGANINNTATETTNNENSTITTTFQKGQNSEMKLTSQQYQAVMSLLQQTSTIGSSSSTQTAHINQLGIVPKIDFVRKCFTYSLPHKQLFWSQYLAPWLEGYWSHCIFPWFI